MPAFERTDYGFKWGSVEVVRIASNETNEWVVIGLETPKSKVQVYATKTGKVRVYINGKEV